MARPKKHHDPELAAARRKQVLDAAERCFLQNGFHGTSMAEISAAAGMSVGHIYNYFENKEAIVCAMAEQECPAFFVEMNEAAVSLPAFIQALQNCVRRHAEEDERHVALIHDVMAEIGRNPRISATLRDLDRRSLGQLVEICARFKPGWPGEKLEATAELLLHLIHGFSMRRHINPAINAGAFVEESCRTVALLLE